MIHRINTFSESFYTETQAQANLKMVEQNRPLYLSFMQEACGTNCANLETYIIEAFAFIESRFDPNVTTPGGATGIMQIDPATASNVLHWLQKIGTLTDQQIAGISRIIGYNKTDKLLRMKWENYNLLGYANGIYFTTTELRNPELNIWLGTLYLDYLISKHSQNGETRMDRVIVQYNAGRGKYNKISNLSQADTLNSARNIISPITANYILKLIGKNGMIDILTR